MPLTLDELEVIVSDYFENHNVGGIGVFVLNRNSKPQLKLIVGLKKYTCDPPSVYKLLFGHSYAFLEDVDEVFVEIIKYNFDVLNFASEVNVNEHVYKVKYYKKKLEDDEKILPSRMMMMHRMRRSWFKMLSLFPSD